MSRDQIDVDIELPIDLQSATVARYKLELVFVGRGADESVVNRATGDADRAERGDKCRCGARTEKFGFWKCRREQPRDRRRSPACRRRQAGQHRERLECGVTGKTECPSLQRPRRCQVMIVVLDNECDGRAGVDEDDRRASAGRHRAMSVRPRR